MKQVGTVLIVGANRGLGLQLVKEILSKLHPRKIFATYRNEQQSQALLQLAEQDSKIRVIQLDAGDDLKFPQVVNLVEKEIGEDGLNLLIFNAAINTDRPQSIETMTKDIFMDHFRVNTVAPFLLEKAFLPLLTKAAMKVDPKIPMGIERAVIVNISSIMGSVGLWDVTGARRGGAYAYRSSKCALNMVTRSFSGDLVGKKVMAVCVHPGWVQTDMGGDEAPLSVDESAEGIVKILGNLDESHNGKFYQYDGELLGW